MLLRVVSLIIISCVVVSAQTSVVRTYTHVSGGVADANDAVIEGASVYVEGGGKSQKLITAADGTYKIDLPSGIFQIQASATGFCPTRRAPFRIEQEREVNFSFILIPCPIVNTLNISNGGYKGETDSYRSPFREDTLQVKPYRDGLHILIQYGERFQTGDVIKYQGPKLDGQSLSVFFSYNLLSIRAYTVRFNRATYKFEFQGNVVAENGKQRLYSQYAEVTFKNGVPTLIIQAQSQ